MATSKSASIESAPPPWTLKGTIYAFMIYLTSSDAASLSADPSFLYSPLEASSPFSASKPVGGLGMVQVIRYTSSPVGPYDEMLMVPGNFEYTREVTGKDGKMRREKRRNLKVSRIYVSQERTCWNGRKNWNIPKHLAKFSFEDLPNGSVRIAVHPLEIDSKGIESVPSKTPFFAATYKDIPYLPSFPSSTGPARYLGLNLSLVQPPLPEGKGALGGTEEWCQLMPLEYSSKTSLGWWDLKQGGEATENDALLGGDGDGDGLKEEGHENWWPGLGRWRIGMKMEDAVVKFPEGEHWSQSTT